ncbi:PQQ-dependent sugar dehydrogenase, partial [Balamuthia mandrillaris]
LLLGWAVWFTLSVTVRYDLVGEGFVGPLDMKFAPGETDHFYLVERQGFVRKCPFQLSPTLQRGDCPVWLDVSGSVATANGEQGLLSIGFHPVAWDPTNSPSTSYYYILSTNNAGDTLVQRGTLQVDGTAAAPTHTLLGPWDQPQSNHNGGQILFQEEGGKVYLFVSQGDGGGGGDQWNNAQNLDSPLGKIHRVDVTNPGSGEGFIIPPDNPFQDSTIYALGFRNPWRVSIDRETGWMWAGDVGQRREEEISIVVKGGNYGWNCREGFRAFTRYENYNNLAGWTETAEGTVPTPCVGQTADDYISPIHSYSFADDDNTCRSVTGGVVYRGTEIPDLIGKYIFADLCWARKVWALSYSGSTPETATETGLEQLAPLNNVAHIAEDPDGEIFFITHSDGKIWRMFCDEEGSDACATGVVDDGEEDPQSCAELGLKETIEPGLYISCDSAIRIEWEILDAEQEDAGDKIAFTVRGKTHGWIGIGLKTLASGRGMNETDMIMALLDDDECSSGCVTDRYSTANEVPPLDDSQDVMLLSASRDGEYTAFTFERLLVTGDENDFAINLNDTINMLWAMAPPSTQGFDTFHSVGRLAVELSLDTAESSSSATFILPFAI